MTETPETDEIDSTFQQIDSVEWQGTHVWRGTDYSVTREYHIHDDYVGLVAITKWEVDGMEINRLRDEWPLEWHEEEAEYVVEHSGETPEEFARNNHHADPQLEFEEMQR